MAPVAREAHPLDRASEADVRQQHVAVVGVDVEARHQIWAHIRSLRAGGRTVVLTTNYLDEAEALCDRLAIMDRGTFMWLFENSVGFNRFLVGQLNERLGQFIALLEYGRTLDATARLARGIASLFNPILYPALTRHLEITQEEIGALSGISRQNANQCLKKLEKEGLLRLEYGGVTILDLERLRHYGE